ncbi:hypothetical protein CRYUN_Cryun28dG0030400 [Craigia yunnanensis]
MDMAYYLAWDTSKVVANYTEQCLHCLNRSSTLVAQLFSEELKKILGWQEKLKASWHVLSENGNMWSTACYLVCMK